MLALVFAIAFLVVGLIVVAALGGRMIRNAGAGSAGLGDAFGNMIDVFDPGKARQQRDIKEHFNQGPVTRTPDDDEDDRVRILRNPDGTPRAARIKKR
ncbi:MAG: hypothetical protein V9G04_04805 [Nocardioides sp.]|mgnify:CR=1 FL=1